MHRFAWTILAGTSVLSFATGLPGAEPPAQPPNILWIVGENFDLDFGCYGAENVHTPNVDALGGSRHSVHPRLSRPRRFAPPVARHS